MRVPTRFVLPLFLLIVFLGPMALGPVLDLGLGPLGIPFHRVMDRALLISALGALFLFRGHLRWREWWPMGEVAWRQIILGLALAVVSAQAMIGFYLALCGFEAVPLSWPRVVSSLLTALVAALVVPVLEETIFRGFLITVLAEAVGRRAAWVLAALIFAAAHFLKIPSGMTGHPLHFWSGASGMAAAFAQVGRGDSISGRGLNLFLVGLILGGIFLRSGTLWINAALHGGWIFILMSVSALTRPMHPPRVAWLGGDLLGSPVTSAVLLMLGVWAWRYYRTDWEEESPGN